MTSPKTAWQSRRVHPAFRVLETALAGVRTEPDGLSGTVLFRVLGKDSARVLVSLSSNGCRVESREGETGADLIIYCDHDQLSTLLTGGASDRPLRTSGDARLLDLLVSLMRTAKNPIGIRT